MGRGVARVGDRSDTMRANGTFNENSDAVLAEEFAHGVFFDPHDAVQVKYEMVRSVVRDELSATEAAARYGFSRQTLYSCKRAVEREGVAGLVPKKRGPRDGYKLNAEAKRFVDDYLAGHPGAGDAEVARALEAGTGVRVNSRTIGRYLSKKR